MRVGRRVLGIFHGIVHRESRIQRKSESLREETRKGTEGIEQIETGKSKKKSRSLTIATVAGQGCRCSGMAAGSGSRRARVVGMDGSTQVWTI
jgi:hypothetical protein